MKLMVYVGILTMLILFPFLNYSQSLVLDSLTSLNALVSETSGLIYLNGKLITHNDSGGEAHLYEIDTLSGNIIRTVVIGNASHTDWEDISYDESYIYIGDFGNNEGTRQDLKVYKISIADFLHSDTVFSETISFMYADQTSFSPMRFQTNFDAEALISWGDSLYIFSKNWGNMRSNVYPLSKNPGTYSISRKDSIDTQGLITGASLKDDVLLLCGYTFTEAFVIRLSQWRGSTFSLGQVEKFPLQIQGSFQVESVAAKSSDMYYLSAEGNASSPANLYQISLEDATGIRTYASPEIKVYPVPATQSLFVESDFELEVGIYNINGQKLLFSTEKELDISSLTEGFYTIKIYIPIRDQWDIRKVYIDG